MTRDERDRLEQLQTEVRALEQRRAALDLELHELRRRAGAAAERRHGAELGLQQARGENERLLREVEELKAARQHGETIVAIAVILGALILFGQCT